MISTSDLNSTPKKTFIHTKATFKKNFFLAFTYDQFQKTGRHEKTENLENF